jgi:hypothetical protein
MNVILGRVEDANPDLEFPDVQLQIWSLRFNARGMIATVPSSSVSTR